jgi:hypothetical protein
MINSQNNSPRRAACTVLRLRRLERRHDPVRIEQMLFEAGTG